jgi:hypothetical protein
MSAVDASTASSFQPNRGAPALPINKPNLQAESAALMTPVAWFDGIAIVIVVGCALLAFGKVRERRRKARREGFLRGQQYHDQARRMAAPFQWRSALPGKISKHAPTT